LLGFIVISSREFKSFEKSKKQKLMDFSLSQALAVFLYNQSNSLTAISISTRLLENTSALANYQISCF
jgi:hypothetical protein